MQKSHDLTKKQLVEIVLVTTVMGLGLLVYDFLNTNINFDGTIKRNDAGKGILTEDLKLEFLDQNQEMSVEVSDRSLTGRKMDEAFDKAISEIQETYLGQNEAADNVIYDPKASSRCAGAARAYVLMLLLASGEIAARLSGKDQALSIVKVHSRAKSALYRMGMRSLTISESEAEAPPQRFLLLARAYSSSSSFGSQVFKEI